MKKESKEAQEKREAARRELNYFNGLVAISKDRDDWRELAKQAIKKLEYVQGRFEAALRFAGAKHLGGGVWEVKGKGTFLEYGCTDDPKEGLQ